ncbi:MAG: PilZ domain-containing protein [Planctomycetaceae bacterium]|nr:PilZ domain-containing protein [Planctomycetaceae bacterium]
MDERRRFPRVPYFRPLTLTLLPSGQAVTGNSFDISRGGVGLVASASLQRGQSVNVHFKLENQRRQVADISVMGKIAYTRADENGNYIGVEFLEEIRESSQPELTRLLDNL